MASKYWIKLYHEILDDPKMGKLSDHIWRRCLEFFLIAGDYDRDGELPNQADIAWRLRTTITDVTEALQALRNVSVTTVTEKGDWHVTNFKKRQSRSKAAERMQKYRERQRNSDVTPVTKRNDCYAPDIDIDTDIDTEQKNDNQDYLLQVITQSNVSDTSANADDQWLQYHDAFLVAYQKVNPYMAQIEKEAILDVAMENDADPEKWDKACIETKLNLNGIKATVARVIDVYRAGGTWAQWLAKTYPGKTEPQGKQSKKPVLTPEQQEVYEELVREHGV